MRNPVVLGKEYREKFSRNLEHWTSLVSDDLPELLIIRDSVSKGISDGPQGETSLNLVQLQAQNYKFVAFFLVANNSELWSGHDRMWNTKDVPNIRQDRIFSHLKKETKKEVEEMLGRLAQHGKRYLVNKTNSEFGQ